MCLYIIHFLLAVNYDKKVVQTHFLLLFVNKKYPETYILLWKGGWFWLFTHFANKKPSASPRAFYCCKMCKKSKSPPFLYYKKMLVLMIEIWQIVTELKIQNVFIYFKDRSKIKHQRWVEVVDSWRLQNKTDALDQTNISCLPFEWKHFSSSQVQDFSSRRPAPLHQFTLKIKLDATWRSTRV